MPSHQASNRIVVTKSDPAETMHFMAAAIIISTFIIGVVSCNPQAWLVFSAASLIAIVAFSISGSTLAMVFTSWFIHASGITRHHLLVHKSPTRRGINRLRNRARAITPLDHETLRAVVSRSFSAHRGSWALKQLEFELDVSRREKERLKAMLAELVVIGEVVIDGHVVYFRRPKYSIPDTSPYRSTVPDSPRLAGQGPAEHKGCQAFPPASAATQGSHAGAPKASKPGRGKSTRKPKKDVVSKQRPKTGKGRPRRAKPGQEKAVAAQHKWSARVTTYLVERGKKGTLRLTIEQIKNGLGLVDQAISRLRTELDKLVRRGDLGQDGAAFTITAKFMRDHARTP